MKSIADDIDRLTRQLAEAREQAADMQRIGIEWMQRYDKRAKELAEAKAEAKTLRNYALEIEDKLAEAQAELNMWRASFPGSAEAVKRDALEKLK